MSSRTGPNKWRDSRKPKTILRDWCVAHNKDPPVYGNDPTSVTVDGVTYTLSDFGKALGQYSLSHEL